MITSRFRLASRLFVTLLLALTPGRAEAAPIYITFVWHMHQPIYWPGESLLETAAAGHYSFDLVATHTDRSGPYTGWPRDAIGAARAAGLGRCGAQVSLTGSLMENLDVLEAAGTAFGGWKGPWQEAAAWRTDGGNPALDLIGFGYFHPLMALVEPEDLATQIRIHRLGLERRFPELAPSRGLFPPETAFSVRMIPALAAAGVDWVVVDNVHFDRTLAAYPYTPSSNLIPPNAADQRTESSPSWVSLSNIWAPGQLSAPFGYQPHRARYLDPSSGQPSDIIVVPGARYEGNEDARGGFGALDYDAVLSQLEPYNQDPDHPMLVVLHHDGDNYGGGSDSYYHANFAGFVSWLQANPARFQCITIEDYLALYPPDPSDVIHVEDGSWSGADNGDPEFQKWNGDPGGDGYSPDRHSWAVLTAARNRVATATSGAAMPSDEDVLDGAGDLGRAWRFLLMAQASDYWYWDGTEEWDSQVTRASNLALEAVDPLLASPGAESVSPTIYLPQREPYNPGALEWGPGLEEEALTIWTFVYDVSGLARVELHYRIDADGRLGNENMRYDGGAVCVEEMAPGAVESRTNPLPWHIATRYQVTVPGLGGYIVDYWVEAEDDLGNVARSPIQHVFVEGGGNSSGAGVSGLYSYPSSPTKNDAITVVGDGPGAVHWGVNGWTEPAEAYWPAGTTAFGDGKAVDTPLSGPDLHGRYLAVLGPFDGAVSVTALDWVIRYQDGTWSSPDQHLSVSASQGAAPSVELVRPEGGAQVSGEILLVAAAADDGGEPRVTFLADGVVLGELTSRPYELLLDTSSLVAGAHTLTARAEDGQNNQAESSVAVSVGGSGPAECRVVGPGPDGSVGPLPDGGVGPGADGGSGPADEGGAGCGCVGAPGDAGDGTEYTAAMIFVLSLLAILGLRSSRRHLPRPFRSRGRQEARPRELLGLGLAVGLGAVLVAACGPSGGDPKDASPHDASFQGDGGNPTGDASLLDSGTDPDASTECTQDATGRTGTTIYLYDSLGQESGDPITVGTVVTVVVEIEISVAPEGNIGFLQLETKNLSVDRTSFTLGGGPLEVSDPFDGVIPLTLTLGVHEVSFEAAVQSNVATLEVDAALGHGDGGRCPMARSHSLAVLQVLGGVQKAVDCYDLDDARSVQVSPHVPLDSTSQYLAENGLRADVLIDNLVVGGPQCPGPGVLVHQISKCFYRQAGSTVTLSGAAYGGEGWFVDDLLLVEILDAGEDVVAAFTTFQIGTQNLNCCQSPPCTSSLTYDSGGVAIQNLVQGGGNNGAIAAGAFDLTPHLPAGSGPFFLRFTALDQGVEGALDRVFLNIGFP